MSEFDTATDIANGALFRMVRKVGMNSNGARPVSAAYIAEADEAGVSYTLTRGKWTFTPEHVKEPYCIVTMRFQDGSSLPFPDYWPAIKARDLDVVADSVDRWHEKSKRK